MQLLKFGVLAFAMFGLFAQPIAADMTLVSTKVKDMETCLETLQEFNWVCQEFDHGGWARTYGQSFWSDKTLEFYRYDLDADGVDDAIISYGPMVPGYDKLVSRYLFGDQPQTTGLPQWGISVRQPITIMIQDGQTGLAMDSPYSNFISVEKVRKNALRSPQGPILSDSDIGASTGPNGEVVLSGLLIRTMQACMTALEAFNWLCQEFNHPGWARSFGLPFWEKGLLLAYRYDIDGDGTNDAIVKVEHVGLCSRGGPACAHYFLFGDQPTSEHPHGEGAIGDGPIVLSRENGVESLYFQRFPERDKNYTYNIEEIRSNTLESQQRSIHPRGVGE